MRYHLSCGTAFGAALLAMAVATPSRAQTAFPLSSGTASTPKLAQQGGPAPADAASMPEDKRSIDELSVLYANTLVWGMGFGTMVGVATRAPNMLKTVLCRELTLLDGISMQRLQVLDRGGAAKVE